jgi:hypothetical protein
MLLLEFARAPTPSPVATALLGVAFFNLLPMWLLPFFPPLAIAAVPAPAEPAGCFFAVLFNLFNMSAPRLCCDLL